MANYHVVPDSESGTWRVVQEGAEQASRVCDTEEEAERVAKELSANSGGGEVRIHRPDGVIRDSDTVPPGNDPFPPRDTKH